MTSLCKKTVDFSEIAAAVAAVAAGGMYLANVSMSCGVTTRRFVCCVLKWGSGN